jgi:putative cardiolipin synthase
MSEACDQLARFERQLPAHSGYAKTRRRLLENGMSYTSCARIPMLWPGWSPFRASPAACTKAMAFDGEAVFIGSFNLTRAADQHRSRTLYRARACRKADRLQTGVVPVNSYRVLLDPNGEIVWETVWDAKGAPPTSPVFPRRRFVANLLKLLPFDSQL